MWWNLFAKVEDTRLPSISEMKNPAPQEVQAKQSEALRSAGNSTKQKIPEAEASGNLLEVTTRFELVDEGFADPCLTTWPRHHIGSDEYHSNGAADEARTRYLHLGKVALYQMSYGRIFGAFVPAPSHSYFKRDPRKNLRSKVLWGRGGISEFVTAVLLVRLPDKRLTFRRSDPDRARTDDPQRDRLVL